MDRGDRIRSGRRRGKRPRSRRVRPIVLVAGILLVALAAGAWTLSGEPELTPPEAPVDPQTDRERVVARAFELIGLPYEWGSKGPRTYDCSGLTTEAYAAGDFALPDGSYNQAEGEQPLDLDALQPADLILYRWSEDSGIEHVVLYVGDGWVIGTGSPGHAGLAALYPLADDLDDDGRVLTYRHVTFPDER